jgi:hypothetical protein
LIILFFIQPNFTNKDPRSLESPSLKNRAFFNKKTKNSEEPNEGKAPPKALNLGHL